MNAHDFVVAPSLITYLFAFPFVDIFRLVTDENGFMDHKQLGLLLHDSLQVKS